MLARAGARERQITIRLALGATRARMIRELLSESLLLSVVGAICGLFLAFAVRCMLVACITRQSTPRPVKTCLHGAPLNDTSMPPTANANKTPTQHPPTDSTRP